MNCLQPDEVCEYSSAHVEDMIHPEGYDVVMLGKGASATVYMGVWFNRTVAVKKINPSFGHGPDQFLNEMNILRRANHAHVVTLLGYCREPRKMALIYEYAEEGSLHDHLFGDREQIGWILRLRIVVEAARGIEYLHYGCRPTIFHRDIKSENILLFSAGGMVAKVADFGASKSLGSHRGDHANYGKTHHTTKVVGTRGHLDPEYFSSGHMKDKSDVFSFGVLILELISGRESLVFTRSEAGTLAHSILDWVKSQKSIKDLPDKFFAGNYNREAMTDVIKLAKACVQSPSTNRPDMRAVLRALESAYEKESAHQEKDSAGKKHSRWFTWWRRS